MIKAVIYDMDNLMVDSIVTHSRAIDAVLKIYGHSYADVPEALRAKYVGMRLVDILKSIIDYFKINVKLEDLEAKREKIFLEFVRKEMQAMPGLVDSLKFFKKKGLKIAVGTSGTDKYLDIVLDKFNLRGFFDVVVSGSMVKKGKPDPETYLVVCRKLNLNPAECVVLEDAFEGVTAAKAAGCKAIARKLQRNMDTN